MRFCGNRRPRSLSNWEVYMQIALYPVGYIVVVAGILYGAVPMGIPQAWITVIGVILAGLGIIALSKRTRGDGDISSV